MRKFALLIIFSEVEQTLQLTRQIFHGTLDEEVGAFAGEFEHPDVLSHRLHQETWIAGWKLGFHRGQNDHIVRVEGGFIKAPGPSILMSYKAPIGGQPSVGTTHSQRPDHLPAQNTPVF